MSSARVKDDTGASATALTIAALQNDCTVKRALSGELLYRQFQDPIMTLASCRTSSTP